VTHTQERKKNRKWIGQTLREDSLLTMVIEEKLEEERRRGKEEFTGIKVN